jgi:FimV-like protein
MTRLATAMDRSFDHTSETKTMLAPHIEQDFDTSDEDSSGSTITVEQIDLGTADTMEQVRPPVDASGVFKATQKIDVDLDRFDLSHGDTVEHVLPDVSETGIFKATQRIDMDLDYLADPAGHDQADTVQQPNRKHGDADAFSEDVFGLSNDDDQTMIDRKPEELQDTNITELDAADLASGEFQMPEMEPVTMSEVGTKLDLARAYMDMGDPDGARSILQEVLDEGNSSQKQEAQRLLDSIG